MNLTWLEPFLQTLIGEGLTIPLSDRLRLSRALSSRPIATAEELRITIRAVLARSQADAQRIDQCFQEAFLSDEALQALLGAAGLERIALVHDRPELRGEALGEALRSYVAENCRSQVEPAPRPSTLASGAQSRLEYQGGPRLPPPGPDRAASERNRRTQVRRRFLVAAALTLLAALVYGWQRTGPEDPIAPTPPTQTTQEATEDIQTLSAGQAPTKVLLSFVEVERQGNNAPDRPWWQALFALPVLILLVVYRYRLSELRPTPPPPPQVPEMSATQSYQPTAPPGAPTWLSEATLDRFADCLGYALTPEDDDVLDIPRSIQETCAAGGLPVVRLERRKQYRGVLLLVDTGAPSSLWHPAATELHAGLTDRGVTVRRAHFDRTLTAVHFADSTVSLSELEPERHNWAVLLMGELSAWPWTSIRAIRGTGLTQWPLVGVLELRHPASWEPALLSLWCPLGVAVVAADNHGLGLLSTTWERSQGRPARIMAQPVPHRPMRGRGGIAALGQAWLPSAVFALWEPLPLPMALWLHRRLRQSPELPELRWRDPTADFERLVAACTLRWTSDGFRFDPADRQALLTRLRARRPEVQVLATSWLLERLEEDAHAGRIPEAQSEDFEAQKTCLQALRERAQGPRLSHPLEKRLDELHAGPRGALSQARLRFMDQAPLPSTPPEAEGGARLDHWLGVAPIRAWMANARLARALGRGRMPFPRSLRCQIHRITAGLIATILLILVQPIQPRNHPRPPRSSSWPGRLRQPRGRHQPGGCSPSFQRIRTPRNPVPAGQLTAETDPSSFVGRAHPIVPNRQPFVTKGPISHGSSDPGGSPPVSWLWSPATC